MHQVHPIPAYLDNYIWMITHPESKQAIVVDPGKAHGVLKTLKENHLSLAGILVTHHHFDHVFGIKKILRHHDAPVYGPAHPELTYCNPICKEGDTIHLPSMALTLQVLEVPGHTLSHIVFYNQDWLFSGDTLFGAGCGRLFEGSPEQMLSSLTKIKSLADQTQVFCAHEYTQANLKFALAVEPHNKDIQSRIKKTLKLREEGAPTLPSTLLLEKQTNPFLRCDTAEVIAAAEKHTGHKLSSTAEVFAVIRQWKDEF